MPERIRFPSETEKREQEMKEKLLEEGGILYYERKDPETGELKKFVNILGVELETYASKEEIERLKEGLILSEVDQKILRNIAECYKLKQPMMIEGDPGVGKTFLVKKFVKLIHGENAPILELVGTPRTSELEILGHWAPKGLKEEEEKQYKEILRSLMESQGGVSLIKKLEEELTDLNERYTKGEINQQEFQTFFGEITTRYINESRKLILESAQLVKFIKPDTEWEFKEGVLLQAYHGREGRGYILIVDEFNLIPSNYQQIFLQIGGEKGELSKSISFWGNTGRTIYPRGKDTWICFASNYPEKTPGRSEVVGPMTDRLVWITITDKEAEMKKGVIRATAGGKLTKRTRALFKPELIRIPATEQLEWYKVLDEQLGEMIADTLALLDKEFIKFYEEVGDKIVIKGQERRRTQQLEFSGRNLLRVYSYLDHFQVRNPETGLIDITETLRNAFEKYYINRLASSEARKRMMEVFKDVLGLSIEQEELKRLETSEEILQGRGKGLPAGVVLFEEKIMTRKEAIEILVKRALEKEKKEEEKEEEKRELQQAKWDAEDAMEKLLENPWIPESIKNEIRNLLNLSRRKKIE